MAEVADLPCYFGLDPDYLFCKVRTFNIENIEYDSGRIIDGESIILGDDAVSDNVNS